MGVFVGAWLVVGLRDGVCVEVLVGVEGVNFCVVRIGVGGFTCCDLVFGPWGCVVWACVSWGVRLGLGCVCCARCSWFG